jgi:hypothetical protein
MNISIRNGTTFFVFFEPVESADDEPVIVQVQDQVLAHHGQPDYPDVGSTVHQSKTISKS